MTDRFHQPERPSPSDPRRVFVPAPPGAPAARGTEAPRRAPGPVRPPGPQRPASGARTRTLPRPERPVPPVRRASRPTGPRAWPAVEALVAPAPLAAGPRDHRRPAAAGDGRRLPVGPQRLEPHRQGRRERGPFRRRERHQLLIVGSDSRENLQEGDPGFDPNAGPGGQRSDTMMILHLEGGEAQMLSLPGTCTSRSPTPAATTPSSTRPTTVVRSA